MFFTKLLLFTLVSGSVFGATTGVTIGIKRATKKTPVTQRETPSEEEPTIISEDPDDLYSIEVPSIAPLTDTELFINELTGFGNMRANVNVSIAKDAKVYTISGEVFVSMEQIENVELKASLNVNLGKKDFNVDFTYVDGTIFASALDRNYKITTDTIMATGIKVIAALGDVIDIPSFAGLIDTDDLLAKLGSMESFVVDDEIFYEANLFDFLPTITFVSDLDYKMKRITLHDMDFQGFHINVDATTEILGKGHNEVTNPEKEGKVFRDLKEFTDYATASKIKGLANQIKSFMDLDNIKLGVNYDINVTRDGNLTFNTLGSVNFAKEQDNLKARLKGSLVNPEQDINLDSRYDIAYLDDCVYFDYNDELKLKYDVSSIMDLVKIIETRLPTSSEANSIIEKFLPDFSTATSPLFTLISNGDYLGLISYFNSLYVENDTLKLSLNASILGNHEGELLFTFDINSKGLTGIQINNVYAFGYILNIKLNIVEYEAIEVTNKESYTSLNYVGDIFEDVLDLIKQDKFALGVNGSTGLNGSTYNFTGSTQFTLSEEKDTGIGKITINNKHNITIDVTKLKTGEKETALRNSEVLFNYNNNLKGKFNLGSLEDTFGIIMNLINSGDKRLEKYKALLTKDYSSSIISRLMRGEIEAILYQNMVKTISLDNDKYTIELNGDFLKKDTDIDVSNILISLKLKDRDGKKAIDTLSIKGTILDIAIDLNVTLNDYDPNYKGLSKTDSYFDFSDMGVLVEYLLNTAMCNNFTINGNVNIPINLLLLKFNLNAPLSAVVKIEEDENGDEKVYVKAVIQNVDSSLAQSMTFTKFIMYFTDTEVYLVHEGKSSSSRVRLTMSQFFDNLVYYLVNFGLGISTSLIDGREETSSRDIELSKILKSYKYNGGINPEWIITIDTAELSGSSMLGDLSLTLKGNAFDSLLSSLTANIDVSILDVTMTATLDTKTEIPENQVNEIKSYISSHQQDVYGKEY